MWHLITVQYWWWFSNLSIASNINTKPDSYNANSYSYNDSYNTDSTNCITIPSIFKQIHRHHSNHRIMNASTICWFFLHCQLIIIWWLKFQQNPPASTTTMAPWMVITIYIFQTFELLLVSFHYWLTIIIKSIQWIFNRIHQRPRKLQHCEWLSLFRSSILLTCLVPTPLSVYHHSIYTSVDFQ
jgi:hypothetical protein